MRTTIDAAGRVVIPKPLRDKAGLVAGSSLDVRLVGGTIEIEPQPLRVRLVREGRLLVAAPLSPVEPLTGEVVEHVRQQLREERELAGG